MCILELWYNAFEFRMLLVYVCEIAANDTVTIWGRAKWDVATWGGLVPHELVTARSSAVQVTGWPGSWRPRMVVAF